MLFGRSALLPQSVDLGVRLYYAAVQNLIYGCGNVLDYIPLLKAETHHRYFVTSMCSNKSICPSSFPQTYSVTPFKNAEVLQQEYVLVGGAWLYPEVNVANTVHLSEPKHKTQS